MKPSFNQIYLKRIVLAVVTFFAGHGYSLAAGTRDGGMNFTLMNESIIHQLLANNGEELKRSLKQYLATIRIDQVNNANVRSKFVSFPGIDRYRNDITFSEYFEKAEGCGDEFDHHVPASTQFGVPGAPICFDVSRLAVEFRKLSVEEGMIRLAAAAIHEHTHHFQEAPNDALVPQVEAEANEIAAYVALTAKIQQVPVLSWSPIKTPSTPTKALCRSQCVTLCGRSVELKNVMPPTGNPSPAALIEAYERGLSLNHDQRKILTCKQDGRSYVIAPSSNSYTAWEFFEH